LNQNLLNTIVRLICFEKLGKNELWLAIEGFPYFSSMHDIRRIRSIYCI